jgi:predicted acetyltransferase
MAEDLPRFGLLSANAYPGFGLTPAQMTQRFQELAAGDVVSTLWGAFEGDELLGGMRVLDLSVNYAGRFISAGGLGSLAVGLLHKKRGVARDLVRFFLARCAQEGQPLAMLYPFRPDFYHRMGFGFGTKRRRYAFTPASLPRGGGAEHLVPLSDDDLPALRAFCQEQAASRHGFCARTAWELAKLLSAHGPRRTLVGYREGGRLRGYLAFTFEAAHAHNPLKHDLVIKEWLWDGPGVLGAFCAFLHTQSDQVSRIIFTTQEEDFHFLPGDARNGTDNIIPPGAHETNTAGIGLMYRIVSVPTLLAVSDHRDFGGATMDLVLEVNDGFLPANSGCYRLSLRSGRLEAAPPGPEPVVIGVDCQELASLLLGVVGLETLYRLGKVRTAAAAVPGLGRVFALERPQCLTAF